MPDRRSFVRTAGLAAGALALPRPAAAMPASTAPTTAPAARAHVPEHDAPGAREWYEWRTYRLRSGEHQRRLVAHCRDALVPALRRAGTGPVGVFTVVAGGETSTVHLLVPYASAAAVGTVRERLAADAEFQRAGAPVLDAPATAPPYEAVESALFEAFAGQPALVLPPQTVAGRPRLFELRRYESHTERASDTKARMFDDAETAIFRRHGMPPVFLGRAVVGPHLPNLTYLLAYDGMRDRDARWERFVADPEFRALIARPDLSDAAILTRIASVFLAPADGSQI